MTVFLWLALLIVPVAAVAEVPPTRVELTTELGEIVLEVDLAAAPVTAANFLRYVDEERLEGAHFYRVVTLDNQPDSPVLIEVIQGGLGFAENARRLPAIAHETTEETGILHRDGAVSMARLEPGSASSEFFICVGDQPELDFGGTRNPDGQGFAAFGRVIEGMDVVRAIQRLPEEGQMLTETVAITGVARID
jgi:peptidyl-prolyl cis-trans isomerase A (cyclophilin A)